MPYQSNASLITSIPSFRMAALHVQELSLHVRTAPLFPKITVNLTCYERRHFVQQATSEKKRGSSTARRPRNISSSSRCVSPNPPFFSRAKTDTYSSPTSPVGPSFLYELLSFRSRRSLTICFVSSPIGDNGVPSIPPYHLPSEPNLPLVFKYGFYPPITLDTPTRDVLSYLFSPPEDTTKSV